MEERPVYYDGWRVKYRNESGEQKPEFFDLACYELAHDFVNRKEVEGFQITEIAFYVTTLGRTHPLYEKPITKEVLGQMTPAWINGTRDAIRQELGI
jgi:hypothetical protein